MKKSKSKKEIDIVGTAPSALLWTPNPRRFVIGINRACEIVNKLGIEYIIDIGTHWDAPARHHVDYKSLFVLKSLYKKFKQHYDELNIPIFTYELQDISMQRPITLRSLYPKGTSASLAIQLAACLGCEKIHMWGIELDSGGKYFDGKKTNTHPAYYSGQRKFFLNCINYLKKQFPGIEFIDHGGKLGEKL